MMTVTWQKFCMSGLSRRVCASAAGQTRGWRARSTSMFTLHAEHEMNCSTAAARHLASSGVDVYTAIAGAAQDASGLLHPSTAGSG